MVGYKSNLKLRRIEAAPATTIGILSMCKSAFTNLGMGFSLLKKIHINLYPKILIP